MVLLCTYLPYSIYFKSALLKIPLASFNKISHNNKAGGFLMPSRPARYSTTESSREGPRGSNSPIQQQQSLKKRSVAEEIKEQHRIKVASNTVPLSAEAKKNPSPSNVLTLRGAYRIRVHPNSQVGGVKSSTGTAVLKRFRRVIRMPA